MKKMLLVFLALLLAGCSTPAPTSAPTSAPLANSGSKAATIEVQPTAAPLPSATLEPTAAPPPTDTPTAEPTPFTEPVIVMRTPPDFSDGLGFGMSGLALPGQVWEITMGGNVRVYDSASMKVVKSISLGAKNSMLGFLAGDEKYVWALFVHISSDGGETSSLYRVSREDFSRQPVELPATCGSEVCQFSRIVVDKEIVWLGGYGSMWGFNRDSLEPVVQFDITEKAKTFFPGYVLDIDATEDGQIWILQSSDVHYLVKLDRQKLLDGTDQKPEMVYFTDAYSVDWMAGVGGTWWASEESLEDDDPPKPSRLYPLVGHDEEMSGDKAVALPEGISTFDMPRSNVSDGKYLWMIDSGARKLFWFDPQAKKVAGVLDVYPGDIETAGDAKVIMAISFDGKYLWASGSAEILKIALPWVK